MAVFDVVEASIADLCDALDAGRVTSVQLVAAYLERIARFDRHGEHLNSVPVLSSRVFDDAKASDDRRATGGSLGRLDGIPYTVKDSFAVEGQTLAAGSPAFKELVANADSFAVARLRAGGAIVLGRTTMPPMANGGMQRGLYGRAESPYNRNFLTAAFASGSSNGSGTATASSFCTFGLGEETWSSGRAPASNNGLVAYTPSRGVISVRGNWPLVPTMDVVVPHTRSVADLLEVLDVLVVDDPDPTGDFWRTQQWVDLPPAVGVAAAVVPSAGLLGVPEAAYALECHACTSTQTMALMSRSNPAQRDRAVEAGTPRPDGIGSRGRRRRLPSGVQLREGPSRHRVDGRSRLGPGGLRAVRDVGPLHVVVGLIPQVVRRGRSG